MSGVFQARMAFSCIAYLKDPKTGFFAAPYRVLFFCGYLWAFASMLIWPLGPYLGLSLQPAFDPIWLWHGHEMIFGFAGATCAGYLLSSVTGWAKRAPVCGWPLAVLFASWLLARLAMLVAELMPTWLLLMTTSAYALLVAVILGREIILGKAYHRLPFSMAFAMMGGLQAAFLWFIRQGEIERATDCLYLVVVMFGFMMTIIGGRMLPALIDNWLVANNDPAGGQYRTGDVSPWPLTFYISAGFIFIMNAPYAASLLLVAGALAQIAEMRHWHIGQIMGRDALLSALSVGYLLVPMGFIGLALPVLAPDFLNRADAMHLMTAAAKGCMIMAITGRSWAYRKGGLLQARPLYLPGFILVLIAAMMRIFAHQLPDGVPDLLFWSACFWCVGWGCFIVGILPAMRGLPARPVLSGTKQLARQHLAGGG